MYNFRRYFSTRKGQAVQTVKSEEGGGGEGGNPCPPPTPPPPYFMLYSRIY